MANISCVPFHFETRFTDSGYSLEDIMEALGCSNKKAISIMKELDTDAGIGLIEKKRQGQGKPTMIYLKQFMVQDVQKCRNFTWRRFFCASVFHQ